MFARLSSSNAIVSRYSNCGATEGIVMRVRGSGGIAPLAVNHFKNTE